MVNVTDIKTVLSLQHLSTLLEPQTILAIVESAAQTYGTTTNKIHLQRIEIIDQIWEDIYRMMMLDIERRNLVSEYYS